MDSYLKIARKYAVWKMFKNEEQYIEEVQQLIGFFVILVCWHIIVTCMSGCKHNYFVQVHRDMTGK